MPVLSFKIRDKVITHSSNNPYYVCGNSDYIVKLDMDAEWDYSVFTAVVKWKDSLMNYHAIPIPFCGDSFVLPIINDAYFIEIGIFAGNKRTTTPGIIACRSSITSGSPDIDPPSEDVYVRIMEMLDSVIASNRAPYIGANKHWYEWDADSGNFIDTGINAEAPSVVKGLPAHQKSALMSVIETIKNLFYKVTWEDDQAPIRLVGMEAIFDEFTSAFERDEDAVYQDGDILHINGNVNAEKNNTTLEVTSK